MISTTLADLEKDTKFKRLTIPRSYFLKSILIWAPALLLFIGLFGALYLFNLGMLISWYSIFYLVCFVLGTIWLKAIREYIAKTAMKKDGAFLACWATPIQEYKSGEYFIFTTGNRRHDKFFIENIKKELNADRSMYLNGKLKKNQAVSISSLIGSSENVYLVSLSKTITKRRNPNRNLGESLPILYIDDKHISPIAGRYLV